MKYLLLLFVGLLTMSGVDCRRNPVGPPAGPDTTSNNYTWTQYTFGGNAGSSDFNDVAIINDSDIWAVGQIYTSPDTMYNAAHWDGREWELIKVPYSYQGLPLYHPITSVFAVDENDIWFAGNGIEAWDGNSFQNEDGINAVWGPYEMEKIWMNSDKNVYVVGDSGSIAHYTDGSWTKMQSGTTIDLRDVWGSPDGSVVWACGYKNYNVTTAQSVLLRYDGTGWKTVWTRQGNTTPPYGDLVTSLWGNDSLYLVGTNGVFREDLSGKDSVEHLFSLTNFPYGISGSADNNIAFVGDDAMIYHFNGSSWKLMHTSALDQPLYSVAVSKDLIVAVGSDYSIGFGAALIYMGRPQ